MSTRYKGESKEEVACMDDPRRRNKEGLLLLFVNMKVSREKFADSTKTFHKLLDTPAAFWSLRQ